MARGERERETGGKAKVRVVRKVRDEKRASIENGSAWGTGSEVREHEWSETGERKHVG